MTIIKDRSGDVQVTRRAGYWLLEQDADVISLSDESMEALVRDFDKECWNGEWRGMSRASGDCGGVPVLC